MLASFTSAYNSIKKVLNYEEGFSLAQLGHAIGDFDAEMLGGDMLRARKNFYYSIPAFLFSSAATFFPDRSGKCSDPLVSLLLQGTYKLESSKDEASAEACKGAIACLCFMGGCFFAAATVDDLKRAAYAYHRDTIATPPNGGNGRGFVQQTLLDLSESIYRFVPGMGEYLGGAPFEMLRPYTFRRALVEISISSLIAIGALWSKSHYFSEYPTGLADCFTSYACVLSGSYLLTSCIDIVTTAQRVHEFCQRRRAE